MPLFLLISLSLSSLSPNSFTLTHSPLPATHHHSFFALIIKQNPFPLEGRTSPCELLLIAVHASLFDSLQMSLTSCKQDSHTHRVPTQPQVKCGCNLCHETRPLLASLLSETSTCCTTHWCLISDCVTSHPLWCNFWPLIVEMQGEVENSVKHPHIQIKTWTQTLLLHSLCFTVHYPLCYNPLWNTLLQHEFPTTALQH